MSTKQGVLKECLSINSKFRRQTVKTGVSNSDWNQINLNQKHKCEDFKLLHFKSTLSSCNDRENIEKLGFVDQKYFNEKNLSNLWKKKRDESKSDQKFCIFQEQEKKAPILMVNEKNSCSTLSLHIAAYENGINTLDDKEKNMVKTSDQEMVILRQQESDKLMAPEIMEFKASQKLFYPNKHDKMFKFLQFPFRHFLPSTSRSTFSFSSVRSFHRSTIFALASGSFPSGVAIIRISGSESFQALKQLTRRKNDNSIIPKQIFYTKIYSISDAFKTEEKVEEEILDHCMAVWLPGPHTFTGENTVELYLHGSKAVVNAVCKSLLKIENIEAAKAGEFTKRAFFNGKYNISQVESLNDLINAETESQRKLAMKQNKAGKYLEPIREKVINLMAQIQASIDFGEDIENQRIENFSNAAEEILCQLRKFERGAKRGSLIRDGIKVAIVGKTNVGKSSLLNRLAEKDVAIVSDICGTTRDYLETRLHLNAVPVTVVDTAGIRETSDPLEKEGIRRSFENADEANIIVYVFDAQILLDTFENEMKEVLPFLNGEIDRQKIILCLNKSDLLKQSKKDELNHKLLHHFQQNQSLTFIWTSCFEEFGLSTLLSSLKDSINDICDVGSDELILSRQRHILLLQDSTFEMEAFLQNLSFDQALAAEHLQNAANCIGEISGTIVNEQILDKIFSQFCIGK